jgi:hypothetical protein
VLATFPTQGLSQFFFTWYKYVQTLPEISLITIQVEINYLLEKGRSPFHLVHTQERAPFSFPKRDRFLSIHKYVYLIP